MKNKNKHLIYSLVIIGVLLILIYSCKKKDDNTSILRVPVITTSSVSNISFSTAKCGGNITSDGGSTITARGVCWSIGQTPTTSDNKTTDGLGVGSFVSVITGLTNNTTYYVRAYATNSQGTGYGSALSFTTKFTIGDNYGGGIIFYIDISKEHGLVCATTDQDTNTYWFNGTYMQVNVPDTSVGSGHTNTNTIVSMLGSGNYAAKICDDLVLNGSNDWFLPSFNELMLMCTNLSEVGLGSFSSHKYYWSSTQPANSGAIRLYFCDSPQSGHTYQLCDETKTAHVRAVRTF